VLPPESPSTDHIYVLAMRVRRLAEQMNHGRPVTDELDRATAELADELERFNQLGELHLDADYARDASALTA
jgi:hypothetical protein